ncbi:TolC family protein [soil metagenome]
MFSALSRRPARQSFRSARLSHVLVLCLAFPSIDSHAQQTLTLDEALRVAQQRSRQLVAQDFAASASGEMAIAAGQLPDPKLTAGITNLPINGPDRFSPTRDFMTMRSIGLVQEITRVDKRRARSGRFLREAESAEAGRVAALADLRRDTAKAWLDRHYEERMLNVLRTQRAEAALQIEASDAVYRGGRGSQADVFAARSAVALIDDRIRQTERQVTTAKTRLARWIGADANLPLGTPPSLAAVRIAAASLDAQLVRHPQIELLVKQEAMARADADIAQSNKRADWSVELMYSQRGPAYSNMVSVNVSIPLQFDQQNRQDRDVAAKLAVVEQMRAQREEAVRERTAETLGWLQEWHSDRDRLAHYDSELVVLAFERTRAAMAAYRGGSGSLSAVLDARRLEIDTRLDRLRLEMEAAALWARLEYLMGPDVEPAAAANPPARVLERFVDTTEK